MLTSVRVNEILQIQILAVRKCAGDSSPYVRKCAATAIIKVYKFDPEQLEILKPILIRLLNDSTTMVLGSAMCAFNIMCPLEYGILHGCYRNICLLLADFDEWSQVCHGMCVF